jgi:hypothetical protein
VASPQYRRCLAAAVVAAPLAMAAPAHGRDRQISTDNNGADTPVEVSAYGGVVAWSRGVDHDDEGNPSSYHLVLRMNGVARDARVRSFEDPVNPDLGPGRRGRVVAVYSRCGVGGCSGYELDVRSGHERRLTAVTSPRGTDLAPSSWRGRVVFARPSGPAIGLFKVGPVRRLARTVPEQTDLRGRLTAFLAPVGPTRRTETAGERDSAIVAKRFLRSGRGRRCLVARARPVELGPDGFTEITAGRGFVDSPVLDGDFVYWLESVARRRRAVVSVRRRPAPSPRCRRRGRERRTRGIAADSVAVYNGRVFYASQAGVFQLDRRARFR